ncbi:MAG TPA: hypothetical protein VMB51_05270 [Solirubrobacteraceae bacterium]|nr:hypothetical protein [Solirubrobacteraceae bacterium]
MSDQVQAAACLGCFESWLLPDDLPPAAGEQFPLQSGPWGVRCPKCGGVIWITDPMPREEFVRA